MNEKITPHEQCAKELEYHASSSKPITRDMIINCLAKHFPPSLPTATPALDEVLIKHTLLWDDGSMGGFDYLTPYEAKQAILEHNAALLAEVERLKGEITQSREAHRLQVQNYLKICDAVCGDSGCTTCDVKNVDEIATQTRKERDQLRAEKDEWRKSANYLNEQCDKFRAHIATAERIVSAVKDAAPLLKHYENQMASALSCDDRSGEGLHVYRNQLNTILNLLNQKETE